MSTPEIVERTTEEIRHAVEVLQRYFPDKPANGHIVWGSNGLGLIELEQGALPGEFWAHPLPIGPRSLLAYLPFYRLNSPWLYIAANRVEYDKLMAEEASPLLAEARAWLTGAKLGR